MSRVLLLDDLPASDDAFATADGVGPHQRVATAITNMITSKDGAGGQCIGIQGGWGSGKTTVVNLVAKELEKDTTTQVVVFDAWAHEGDPLRRVFLEVVAQDLIAQNWVGQNNWGVRLEELARRRKSTRTVSKRQSTSFGRWMAASIMVVPLGTAFLSNALIDGVALGITLGTVCSLAPGIVALVNWVRTKFVAGDDEATSEWALLTTQGDIDERTVTTERPDPTSLEFESSFSDLMLDALGDDANRRLVVVVDNLDRVGAMHAMEVWATLQTFLQDPGLRARDWFSRLWVVVPYDERRIPRLVPGEATKGRTMTPESRSLLDKSIQVRFDVPPLVLRDWREYMLDLLGVALPDHGIRELEQVYNVFDLYGGGDADGPTPRELKQFVNQVGALVRQWQGRYPVASYAYFCVLRRAGEDIRSKLIKTTLPTLEFSRVYGDEMRAYLAGLLHNVDERTGLELLLRVPITDLLGGQKSSETLASLAENFKSEFWAVLQRVASKMLLTLPAPRLAIAGTVLLGLDEVEKLQDRAEGRMVLSSLRWGADGQESWFPRDGLESQGIANLCRLCSQEHVSVSVLKAVRKGLASSAKEESERPSPTDVYGWVLPVLQQVRSLGHGSALAMPLVLSVEAPEWRELASMMVKNDPDGVLWGSITPSCGAKAVVQELAEAVTNRAPQDDDRAVVRTIAVTKGVSWGPLIASVVGRLRAEATTDPSDYAGLLEFLDELAQRDEKAKSALAELTEPGHLLHHLVAAGQQERVKTIAWILYCYASHRPALEVPTGVGQSAAGFVELEKTLREGVANRAKPFVEVLSSQGALPLLFNVAEARGQVDPLVAECLRLVAASAKRASLFDANVFRQWNKDLLDVLRGGSDDEDEDEDAYGQLVHSLVNDSDLATAIQDGDFEPELDQLYLAVLAADMADDTAFGEWCARGISALTKEGWSRVLLEQPGILDLLLLLLLRLRGDDAASIELKTPFLDALVEHARTIARRGKHPRADLRKRWSEVLDCLAPPLRPGLGRGLWESIVSGTGPIPDSFIRMYGREMVATAKDADARVRISLAARVLKDPSAQSLDWLLDILKVEGVVVRKKHDATEWAQIKDRIPRHVEEPKFVEALKGIAEHLEMEDLVSDETSAEDKAEEDVSPDERESGPSK